MKIQFRICRPETKLWFGIELKTQKGSSEENSRGEKAVQNRTAEMVQNCNETVWNRIAETKRQFRIEL